MLKLVHGTFHGLSETKSDLWKHFITCLFVYVFCKTHLGCAFWLGLTHVQRRDHTEILIFLFFLTLQCWPMVMASRSYVSHAAPRFSSWLSSDHVGTPLLADNRTVVFLLFVKCASSWLRLANGAQPQCSPHACVRWSDWPPQLGSQKAWLIKICTRKRSLRSVSRGQGLCYDALTWTGEFRASGIVTPPHPPTSFFPPAVSLNVNEQKHGKCVHVNGYLVCMQPCS